MKNMLSILESPCSVSSWKSRKREQIKKNSTIIIEDTGCWENMSYLLGLNPVVFQAAFDDCRKYQAYLLLYSVTGVNIQLQTAMVTSKNKECYSKCVSLLSLQK